MSGIAVRGLFKRFPSGIQALRGVSLDVPSGTIVALLGPNGAGKTTLVNCILGLLLPEAGEISLDGASLSSSLARDRIGVVFEEAEDLYGYMTVEENLRYFGLLNALQERDLQGRVEKVLQGLELMDKRRVLTQTLSRGMKQKVALGITWLKGASFLFLDEPTLGLDVRAKMQVIQFLNGLRECGVLLTTHDPDVAYQVAKRFYFLWQGQVIWQGARNQLEATGVFTSSDLGKFMLEVAEGHHAPSNS